MLKERIQKLIRTFSNINMLWYKYSVDGMILWHDIPGPKLVAS
jgi:hypothetical protein